MKTHHLFKRRHWFSLTVAAIVLFINPFARAQDVNINQVTMAIAEGTSVSVPGSVSFSNSGELDNAGTLHIGGNYSNASNGLINNSVGTVIFDGSALQTISGGETFSNLTLNNNAGLILDNNDVTINSTLSLSSGKITTGANTLFIGSAGSISGAAATKYIDGKLARTFASAASLAFPIGQSGNYRPLTVDLASVVGTVTLTAQVNAGVLPGSIPANSSLFDTRYWSVTASGGSNYQYYITLADVGFSPSGSVIIYKGDGNTNSSSAVTAPDYTNSTEFTTFGNFGLGQVDVLTWTGTTSTDWLVGSNWNFGLHPSVTDNVYIPTGLVNQPHITSSGSTPAVCNNLTVETGASLTLNEGKALTVNGTLTNSGTEASLIVESGGSLIEYSGVNATVKRDIIAGEWHLISAPVSNATASVFTGYYLQRHSEPDNKYYDILLKTDALTPMQGFALWGDAGLPTATYTGLLNTGNHGADDNLTRSGPVASAEVDNYGWNLVGNPYPSSIDWLGSGWTKTNVDDAIYLHRNSSLWATFVDGVSTSDGSRFIAPGQGFFVHVPGLSYPSTGTLKMNNAVRVHNTTSFFKNSGEVVPNLIRLEVSGNSFKDEAVVRFLPDATAEFDGRYDAYKIYGDVADAAQIYSLGSTPLSINSLPETNIVPVGVKAGVSGSYTIAATEINDLQYVTLEDTKTGIFTELAKQPYTFTFEAGEKEVRFNLHFNAMTAIADNKDVATTVYSYQKTAYINLNKQLKGDIFIYNMAGQLVATKLSAKGMNEIKLNALGNYIVKVVTDKTAQVKKIYIN